MANNLEVRLLPNGHPYIILPSQLPSLAQLPNLQPQVSQAPDLPPLSSLTQFVQIPQQQMVSSPFDPVLNTPFSVPPQPTGLANPFLDLMQFPLITPAFNPFLPLVSPLTLSAIPQGPVPLMSLRIPTPPSFRAHPYQTSRERADMVIRGSRQKNYNGRSQQNREEKSDGDKSSQKYHLSNELLLGAALRKEAERSEKEESRRRPK